MPLKQNHKGRPLHTSRTAKVRNNDSTNAGEDLETRDHSDTAGGGQMVPLLWKTAGQFTFLQKEAFNYPTTASAPLGVYPRGMKMYDRTQEL
jgi:hypothetical protein